MGTRARRAARGHPGTNSAGDPDQDRESRVPIWIPSPIWIPGSPQFLDLQTRNARQLPALRHCAEKNLHRYLAEFDFRYNTRSITDGERAMHVSSTSLSRTLSFRPRGSCVGDDGDVVDLCELLRVPCRAELECPSAALADRRTRRAKWPPIVVRLPLVNSQIVAVLACWTM
jgi:hypothetical protein